MAKFLVRTSLVVAGLIPTAGCRTDSTSAKLNDVSNSGGTPNAISSGASAAGQDLAAAAKGLLVSNCIKCHGAGTPGLTGGIKYIDDLHALVSHRKVIPGDPDDSPLYEAMSSNDMPPDGESTRPSAGDIDVIRQWIAAGAPNVAPPPTGWTDVTPGGSCTANRTSCMYKNNPTAQIVAKAQVSATWDVAMQTCQSLAFGGFAAGWRLPTLFELQSFQSNGIKSQASPDFISADAIAQFYFWSATVDISDSNHAQVLDLDLGTPQSNSKGFPHPFVCIR